MSKMFAVRDKKTGKFVLWRDEYVLRKSGGAFINSEQGAIASMHQAERELDDVELEVVTFRVEPIEPCIWCREKILGRMSRFIPYDVGTGQMKYKEEIKFAKDWPVCPECGRSLK